jgi:cytochrome c oxidase subunit 3
MNSINTPTVEAEKKQLNPKTFVVWLFIVASTMLFLAFASAYWVHRQDGIGNNAWVMIKLPWQFSLSTVFILLSSITIETSYRYAKKDDIYKVPAYIAFTMLLAGAFSLLQVYGFKHLMDLGYFFSNKLPGEISVSFIYVIAGVHLLHIAGGIVLLLVALLKASNLKIHSRELVFINICKTYWHFLGILWIFLFLFLYFAN